MNDVKAIERAISEFPAAYGAGNLEAVLSYYGDDLVKVRCGAEPETKSDVAQRVKEVFENFQTRVDVFNDEVQVYGEVAFTRGAFSLTLTPKAGGQTQILDRRYLEIWRKQAGHWVVIRAIDNLP